MGVRILVGEADGTTDAAAMYCSTTGYMIGPIFEAYDAADQVEAFLEWLGSGAWRPFARSHGLEAITALGGSGDDARCWKDEDLGALISHWKSGYVGEDGWLLDTMECACGSGHNHIGERGETARHGECASCKCTTWRPGNDAARRAAEGD